MSSNVAVVPDYNLDTQAIAIATQAQIDTNASINIANNALGTSQSALAIMPYSISTRSTVGYTGDSNWYPYLTLTFPTNIPNGYMTFWGAIRVRDTSAFPGGSFAEVQIVVNTTTATYSQITGARILDNNIATLPVSVFAVNNPTVGTISVNLNVRAISLGFQVELGELVGLINS